MNPENPLPDDDDADRLADAALRELGGDPLDPDDEYLGQCEFAGCYPWLATFLHTHPHDAALIVSLNGDERDAPV